MKPLPLKWRISLLVALVIAAVIAVVSSVAYVELHESLRLSAVKAASESRVDHEMREFLRMLLILGGCMTVIGGIIATLIVLWALRPIDRTAERLRGITHRNLGSEHLEELRAPSELAPFITALDDMLARLSRVLKQQRQFTADASHELRTPLALAKSTLQAARTRDRDPAEYRRAIDETLGDLDRVQRLMAQLLVLARLDEVEDLPDIADVPLDGVLQRVAADHAAAAAERGSRIDLDAAGPATVRGNAEQLGRLFGNLVENAIVHGPAGGTVRVSLSNEANGQITVCVHDSGGEIPAEAIPHLFDRFYRADPSRSRATGGAGLGLAIAREIARRHGGDIEITSSPAEGTLASVRLPQG
jgi:two-component system heavy metal sensor histidine kinase CusS